MSRVNRVPFGLQDLLGSQNFGDNPSELNRVIAPTLEMTPFLEAERLSWEHGANTLADNGTIDTFTVPTGEIWYIHGWGASCRPTVGLPAVAYGCQIGCFAFDVPNSNNPPVAHALSKIEFVNLTPTALTTPLDSYGGKDFTKPLVMLGGSSVRFNLTDTYGISNWYTTVNVRYTKLNQ